MIDFSIKNKKLIVTLNNTSLFTDVVMALKNNHCRYNPDTKEWVVERQYYSSLVEDVEEFDTIHYTNIDEINKFLVPPLNIIKQRIPFDLSELKYQPIKGKTPYENYQIEDLQKTLNRNRFGLFLDVGTGKSWIILSAINILRSRNKFNKILYITSNSGVYDIKEKFLQFTDISEDRIQIGNKDNRRPFDLDCDVIICNYRSFLLISDEYQKDIDKGKKHTKDYRKTPIPIVKWIGNMDACCVLDESHNIATPTSRQTKSIHLISDYFNYRYILSGTPADKEEKYYSQLKFLDSALVKNYSYSDWLNEYANIGTRFSDYAIDYFKPHKLIELQSIVQENCSRRLGNNVLDLPPNIVKNIYVSMSELQRKIYETFVKDSLAEMKKSAALGIKTNSFIRTFGKLIMAIDNPENIDTSKITNPDLLSLLAKFKFERDHPKVQVIKDILLDYPDSKVIIWTSHPSVGNKLVDILKEYNPFVLNGEITIPKEFTKESYKNHIVEMFKKDPKRNVLIAGTQVLNSAVTIVEANVQIYVDTDFNYTTTEQTYARIYRIGQKQKVFTYKILVKHSLDITRHKSMENKDFINDHFLSKEYLDIQLARKALIGDI